MHTCKGALLLHCIRPVVCYSGWLSMQYPTFHLLLHCIRPVVCYSGWLSMQYPTFHLLLHCIRPVVCYSGWLSMQYPTFQLLLHCIRPVVCYSGWLSMRYPTFQLLLLPTCACGAHASVYSCKLVAFWVDTDAGVSTPTERPPPVSELVPTFADRGCHVVSATNPYGRNFGFLDRSHYFFFQVAPHLYSGG
jgi:hypothetical protein